MSVMPALLAILLADTGVDDLIDGRVHMGPAAESAPRPLVYLVGSSEDDGLHMEGQNEYPERVFQVVCIADNFPACDALGDAVIEAFRNYAGNVSGKHVTLFREPVDSYDHVPATGVHRRIVGFKARYRLVP